MQTNMFRIFHDSEGNDYRFHTDAFTASINNSCEKHGTKKRLIELLAKETNRSEETVKGWVKGTSDPSDPDTINIIEDVLKAPRGSFRYPVNDITKNEGDRLYDCGRNHPRRHDNKKIKRDCQFV